MPKGMVLFVGEEEGPLPASRRHWNFSPAAEPCQLLLFVFPNSCFISGPLSSSLISPATHISLSPGTCSFSPPSPLFLALHFGKDTEKKDFFCFAFFFSNTFCSGGTSIGQGVPSWSITWSKQGLPGSGGLLGSPHEDEFPCPQSTNPK